MALVMVYGMEVYNLALRNGVDGGAVLRVPVAELAGLSAIVIVLQEFGGGLPQRSIDAVRLNLPMAFAWQILVAGPPVRLPFRSLFARAQH